MCCCSFSGANKLAWLDATRAAMLPLLFHRRIESCYLRRCRRCEAVSVDASAAGRSLPFHYIRSNGGEACLRGATFRRSAPGAKLGPPATEDYEPDKDNENAARIYDMAVASSKSLSNRPFDCRASSIHVFSVVKMISRAILISLPSVGFTGCVQKWCEALGTL